MSDLPEMWACERCNKVVPMDDTCIVPNTLQIICESCDEIRQEKEADAARAEAAFGKPDYDAEKPLTALENWQRNDEHHVK